MKKILPLFLLVLCLRLFSQTISLAVDSRIYTQFIIQLHPANTIKDVTAQFPALVIKRCLSQRMNIWLVERDTDTGAEAFLQQLKQNKAMQQAQFNHHIYSRSVVPNDTYFSNQWDMLNTGQRVGGVNGIPGDDIDATDAWAVNHNNVTVNGDSIVVAIVDVGFDTTHVDINFFVNHHEIPGNGIDDDSDGFVDDYLGWDVYDTAGDISAFGTDPHSMHVSGIAGAIGNNDTGIAGTCWGVKILRVCGSSDEESQVVAAYDYLIALRALYNRTHGVKGAFIVSSNSSFGIDYGNAADFPLWCAMYDSMGAVGILSAAATTNNAGVNVDVSGDMPTTCPSNFLIAVTNSNNQDIIQAGVGKINIDLAAPGTDIYSTELNNGYGYMTGTSMATPHIAGAIAAMYAAACHKMIDDYYAYPDSIALTVRQMLLSGVTPASSAHNETASGGILNLYHAVLNVQEYNCSSCVHPLTDSITQPTCSNSCDGSILISTDGGKTFTYNQQNLCAGFYPVTITDTSGCKQYRNVTLVAPDSIIIYSVTTTWPSGSANGNITVNALAGNYKLMYSLDGVSYQASSTFSVSTPGNYTVYVMSETGCTAQQQVHVTSIDELTAVNNWSLYPNPATDVLNVSVSLSQNSAIQFSITNILGETIVSENQTCSAGSHIFTIPTSSLASGIYFLVLESGGASAKKFMVAR